jgi:hypothetical protein
VQAHYQYKIQASTAGLTVGQPLQSMAMCQCQTTPSTNTASTQRRVRWTNNGCP